MEKDNWFSRIWSGLKPTRPPSENNEPSTETWPKPEVRCFTCAGTGIWYEGSLDEESCPNCKGRGWRYHRAGTVDT